MTTELLRSHDGALHLYSDGRPVAGAVVTGVGADQRTGELQAIITLPLSKVVVGETRNVIPFVRPETKAA